MHATLVNIAFLCCRTQLPLSYEHSWTIQLQAQHSWLTCNLMPCRTPLPLSYAHPWMTQLQTQHRIQSRIKWLPIKQQWTQTSCMAPQTWHTNLHSRALAGRQLGVHNRWACMQCTTTCWFLLLWLHSKALVGRQLGVHNRWACMQCATTCWFLLLQLHSKALVGRQLGVHNRWYCAQCATSRWSFGCPSLACVTMQ